MPLIAPPPTQVPPEVNWHRDTAFWSLAPPDRAEHAFVGGGRSKPQYELIAVDIQHAEGFELIDRRDIGWEIYSGRNFLTLVTKGTAPDFAAAKAAAEAALRAIQDIPAETLRKPVTTARGIAP
jgi:hypothetical protein